MHPPLQPGQFQSSSGPWAGCNRPRPTPTAWMTGFNPHPAPGPDATGPVEVHGGDGGVVSILIRPLGRMQQERPAGAAVHSGFNPHPAPGPDATIIDRYSVQFFRVSILIRPLGRMQQGSSILGILGPSCFNPHPAPGPDATCFRTFYRRLSHNCFNPHPAPGPDATRPSRAPPTGTTMFQSSSGPWAGCNKYCSKWCQQEAMFQSSSGPWAGCNYAPNFTPPINKVVSILIRPLGRMQPGVTHPRGGTDMFQSSSGPWAGCNACFQVGSRTRGVSFNPHPAPGPDAT